MSKIGKELLAEFRALVDRLDDLSYSTLQDPDCEALLEAIGGLQEWGCKVSEHEWIFDQCGFWQHQYCSSCGAAKYPDLAKKSCGNLVAQMGRVSEGEFLASNAQAQAPADAKTKHC